MAKYELSSVQLAEKLKEFEDVKKTLKQKLSNPFVKKQEFKPMEKTRRYEAPRKFEYNRTDKKFPASTNFNKHYEAPVTQYENVQRGHVVENGAIKPSTAKTLAVRKFPEPTAIKQVQSFLGLTGYFRKYIKDYSTIAKPLSELTKRKKIPLFWGLYKKKHLRS
ncbi:transposon Ty3-I Gag-Pol polyprotein [Trichonephila clavipes]|uniref:Transposon Ty3-I Gag-Pol polyprotein n=1 Tax=Trichonephila clavipes TaxID=2585209 RepID=A0A8X6R8E2_TRICX|nr:transposon Ty3-I Gag-Pol polyprotein [Trichonephila clavipes]